MEGRLKDPAGRTLRLAAAAAAALAAVAVGLGLAIGQPRGGLALAAGLMLGSLNGVLARRTIGSALPMSASSLGRLAVLSATGLAAGLLMGVDVVWLVVLGLAAAQILLALAAAHEMLRR